MDLSEFEIPPQQNTSSTPLLPSQAPPNPTIQPALKPISYADIAKQNTPTPIFHNLPDPEKMGDYPVVTISSDALQRGLSYCKHCLLGRLDLQKVTIDRVRELALQKWRPTGNWLITPIGKGYLFIRFDNVEDMNKVWSTGSSWSFDDEPLRLSQW
ncbi:hypothetical protein FRX31_003210, partial [Thalictrum thalictroides]